MSKYFIKEETKNLPAEEQVVKYSYQETTTVTGTVTIKNLLERKESLIAQKEQVESEIQVIEKQISDIVKDTKLSLN